MIHIKNLSFSYVSDNPILENVSFDIEKGEFVAILGPNGSGKTTLIKLLLGVIKPNTGTIEVCSDKTSKTGYIPQKQELDRFFPGTVREILEAKSKDYLKTCEYLSITDRLDTRFSMLSGGLQQRVMMAFSLLDNPDLLILDEPTVGVDIRSMQEFYALLVKLKIEKKITIVLVTHDVGVISRYVSKVICIKGSMTCVGTPEETPRLLANLYGEHFDIHLHDQFEPNQEHKHQKRH
ncbi:metal ABC transporter ATP-binding protein [Candidatus Micrarchaeota archaeon]|nr:metal ABC transporter ATP-binding protein [Candidatus Micrarchaeota archaeon]